MIRTNTKDTVIVNGGVQTFEFENDVDAVFDVLNTLVITDNVPNSSSIRLTDKNKNGFIWRYVGNTDTTQNVLNLHAVINNVIQPNIILSINQSTLQVVFNNSLQVRNQDGTISNIGSNQDELTTLLNNAKSYTDTKISDLIIPSLTGYATQNWVTGLNYITASALSDLATNTSLTNTLANYVLSSSLSSYVTNTSLLTSLNSYLTIADFDVYKNSQSSSSSSSNILGYKDVNITPYQILQNDNFLGVNTLNNQVVLNLPSGSNATIGQSYKIMDASGNALNNNIFICGNIVNPSAFTRLVTLNAGSSPFECAITPNKKYAYVINKDSNNVTIIKDLDTQTPSVLKTLATGTTPYDVKITPNGNFVYICNSGSNNITVIKDASTTNPTVLRTLALGSNPQNLIISPDGNNVYVSCSGINKIYILYGASSSPQLGINITTGTTPFTMAITPDGNYLYVCNLDENSITIIQNLLTSPSVLTTINVGINPYQILITPSGNYAYVYCYGSPASLYVIKNVDTNTPSVLTNFIIDAVTPGYLNKHIIKITTDGKYLYLGCSSMSIGTLNIYKDVSTDNPVFLKSINTGTCSNVITMFNENKMAYISNSQYGISIVRNIDTDTPVVLNNITWDSTPNFLYLLSNSILYNVSGGKIAVSSLSKKINSNFGKAEFIYNGSEWLSY